MKKILVLVLIACSTNVFSKDVRCKIDVDGVWHFKQLCSFKPPQTPSEKGSFVLRSTKANQPLLPDMLIQSVAVYIKQKNVAEIRAKSVNGDTSSWGMATRSLKNRACWVTENGETSICAY